MCATVSPQCQQRLFGHLAKDPSGLGDVSAGAGAVRLCSGLQLVSAGSILPSAEHLDVLEAAVSLE